MNFNQIDDRSRHDSLCKGLKTLFARYDQRAHKGIAAFLAIGFAGFAVVFGGCSEPPEFRLNAVEVRKQEIVQRLEEGESYPEDHLRDISNLVTALFGTPDDPRYPTEFSEEFEGILPDEPLVSLERLRMAAGPVSSELDGTPRGLYREHCVHCHGITGDGSGPTAAFLNPYPRDYRMGIFKFKSTAGAEKPTREDLRQILTQGIPGTSMSSFRLLSENEIESLIDYVIYLSIRGEVERILIQALPEEFDFDEKVLTPDPEDPEAHIDNLAFLLEDLVVPIMNSWRRAEGRAVAVPPRPETLAPDHERREEMIRRGRELFMSASSGNCYSCHGYSGLGDGVIDNYDDWTKDWVEGGKVDVDNPEEVDEFIALGALPPRTIRPRNLRLGVYRGGRRNVDLYWRIKNGIKGSPMPGAASSLTDEDIWCLVEYVRQLPYESLSEPQQSEPLNAKGVR